MSAAVQYAWNEYLAAVTEAEPDAYEYVEMWAWNRLQDRLARADVGGRGATPKAEG